jgi:BirA family biotin operon repressor/biotin-[acetyl-CoA-carboxylase] ligase
MPPDDLSPATITDGLETHFIGQRVVYFPRLSSTMDAARREAKNGTAAGTVILAGEQTEGRGRVGRVWLAPGGNIALSVVLRPEVSGLPYLIMVAALSVAGAIEAAAGIKTQIKWPNDVLVKGKKVCGILVESEVKGGRVDYAVIGIGINVALDTSEAPSIQDTATSLNAEAGREVPRTDVVRRLLAEMERLYLVLPDGGAIYRAWRERLITLGKRVYVSSGGSRIEGMAEDVDGDGALLLRRDDGSLMRIIAGDVTVREK